ncbi:MAG: hypothetical protein KAT26_00190, partial [Marinosulfonomonas sp.]|nr:hypothetical protein [Marinosulfonomonas sp.]
RVAISQYQTYLGYPETGRLTEYQRDFLVDSYYRAVSGDQTTPGLIAQDPYAARNLLRVYQGQPGDVAPATASGLPTSVAAEGSQILLSSHCNRINLTTNTNGGFVTEATMSDPNLALNEQFCLARSYAIVLGEDLAGQVKGVSRAQFEEQCAAFGPTMQDYVTALSQKNRRQMFQDVTSFAQSTGMSPAQLGDTAKVCLSVGYSTDSLDVALGSALLLTALGEAAYGELLGHHLTQGFGTGRRPDLALEWYQGSFDAINGGAPAVFAPEDFDRGFLIQKAALQLNGGAASTAQGQTQSGSVLPVFSVGSD